MKEKYKYYRIFYSLFALISLSAIIIYQLSTKTILLWNSQLAEMVLASAGMIAGLTIMIVFIKKFFFELSGADVFYPVKSSNSLLQLGLYKYVRHPLYAATLLFIWSIFFLYPALNVFISCVCITIYTLIGIRFEERKLIVAFGISYIQYKKTTPMIIPGFFSVFK